MSQKRQKAQDIFNETEFVFAKKGTFEEAFPEIQDIRAEVTEEDHVISWGNGTSRTYTKHTFPGEYVNCSNTLCYNGGFSIGSILRDMVSKRETHREEYKICQGYEGSPKGRRKYRDCMNAFRVKIDIIYRESE